VVSNVIEIAVSNGDESMSYAIYDFLLDIPLTSCNIYMHERTIYGLHQSAKEVRVIIDILYVIAVLLGIIIFTNFIIVFTLLFHHRVYDMRQWFIRQIDRIFYWLLTLILGKESRRRGDR